MDKKSEVDEVPEEIEVYKIDDETKVDEIDEKIEVD